MAYNCVKKTNKKLFKVFIMNIFLQRYSYTSMNTTRDIRKIGQGDHEIHKVTILVSLSTVTSSPTEKYNNHKCNICAIGSSHTLAIKDINFLFQIE
jgi:hypothetical protein